MTTVVTANRMGVSSKNVVLQRDEEKRAEVVVRERLGTRFFFPEVQLSVQVRRSTRGRNNEGGESVCAHERWEAARSCYVLCRCGPVSSEVW